MQSWEQKHELSLESPKDTEEELQTQNKQGFRQSISYRDRRE